MSDDLEKSSSDAPKRAIKIGSQRPGHEPVPEKKKVAPTVPQPVHRETPSSPPSGAEREPAKLESGDSKTAQAAEPTENSSDVIDQHQEIPKQAAESPAVPSDSTLTADAQAIVDQVTAPDIDLDVSDEDLEREIVRAMGEGVEDLMASQVSPTTDEQEIEFDQRYLGTVVKIYRESALFELPGQRNGAVPLRQFQEVPEVGAQLEVLVTGFSAEEQMYELVVPGASVHVEDWSDLAEGAIVEGNVTGHNKGGLEVEVNHIRGFIPAREISVFRVEDFSTYVGQRLSCVVKEVNESRRNLVLSHRAILEREREEARQKLLEELAVGQTRDGTVARLEKFGAFIDLGGVDGLIHISQLSWDNIRHPDEVLTVGQQIKVRIDKMDPETGRIGLSYRDLLHQPWDGIDVKYPLGTVVEGTVSKIMDFGAFVKLEPGVEGLVHISELAHQRVNRVAHVVQEGQSVDVKVLAVDSEAQKISLSIKAALAAPAPTDATGGDESDDEPALKHVPKVPIRSLKGGIERPSGGEEFGLKW